nr:ATP-dependent DNA helicase PIF1-like [Tanacetum cinerariifolium]
MMQNYQDVMALCHTYGNPDRFITFTSNQSGPRLIFDIILAELPSPTDDPDGYKIITDYMLHGPCGKDGRYAPCTIEGKCSKRFPKPFYVEIVLDEDKYPIYYRRDNKAYAKKALLEREGINVTMFTDWFNLNEPLKLWEETWEVLSEDILYKKQKLFRYPDLQLSSEQIQNYCLVEIQESLNRNGRSLIEFQDLPRPNLQLLTNMDNRLIKEALEFDMNKSKMEHQQLRPLLNPKQRLIYEEVIESVHYQRGHFYFMCGPGGTEKTFLYKTIISRLRSERKIVLTVASSGIASLLLLGRRTTHSRFVIPLGLLENSTCGIKQNTHLAVLMQEVQLIIWDEAPMTQKYALEALDKTLMDILGFQRLEKRDNIFGGMTVLLGGDFRQILPVIPKGKRPEANGEIDTQKQDFNKWVLAVGNGTLPAKSKDGEDEPTWTEIPEKFIIKSSDSPIEQIFAKTYPNFIERQCDDEYLKERAILTPKNDDADAINAYIFDMLAGFFRCNSYYINHSVLISKTQSCYFEARKEKERNEMRR